MNMCEQTEQQLTDLYFGEGSMALTNESNAHLESCSECAAFRAELVETVVMLKTMTPTEEAGGFKLRTDQRAVLVSMIDDIGSAQVEAIETVATPTLTLKRSVKVDEEPEADTGTVIGFLGWYSRKKRHLMAGVAMAACLCVVMVVLHHSEDLPTKSTVTSKEIASPLTAKTDSLVLEPKGKKVVAKSLRKELAYQSIKSDEPFIKSKPALRIKPRESEKGLLKKKVASKCKSKPLMSHKSVVKKRVVNGKVLSRKIVKCKVRGVSRVDREEAIEMGSVSVGKRSLKHTKADARVSGSVIATRTAIRMVTVPKFTYSSVKQAVETLQTLYNKRRKRMKWVRFSYQFHASQESLASTGSFRSAEVLSKSLKMMSPKELGSVADILADLCEAKHLYYQLQSGRVVIMDRLVTKEPLVKKVFLITADLQSEISILVPEKIVIVAALRRLARREGMAIEAEGKGGVKSIFDYDSKSGMLRVKNTRANLAVLARLLRLLPERVRKVKFDRLLKTAIPLDRLKLASGSDKQWVTVIASVSLKMWQRLDVW